MSSNIAEFAKQARTFPRRVFFTGSTAIAKGQGLCYDADYGVAADGDALRQKRVEVPSSSNNMNFAGVAASGYTAVAGGQWIEIYEPGSICEILVDIAATVNATYLTCSAATGNTGHFAAAGFPGRGSALALQTIAAVSSTTTTPGLVSSSLDGSATLSADGLTLTKTGAFTNAAAGDYVYIVGGATTATMAAAVTPGRYTIASVTSENAVVLTSAACAAASSCAFYCVRGEPTVMALLLGGPATGGQESGLTQWVTPLSGGTVASMVGGFTFIFGGATITTDNTETLADGSAIGQRKGYKLMGALTTNDHVITATTAKQLDGSTALATMEFDGASDQSILEWLGPHWKLIANSGTGLA